MGYVDTLPEERLSAATHAAGFIAAVGGLLLLLRLAGASGDALVLLTVCIFGLSMVMVYLASTLLHLGRRTRLGPILLELDHTAIYLLIAGTYTPFVLVAIGGAWGWTLFAAVWCLAGLGLLLRLGFGVRHLGVTVPLYLLTGWVGLVAIGPVLEALSAVGVLLILLGGLAYTVGVVFFAWRRLRFNHAIWHLFVCAGTAFHFAAVWHEVVPRGY